MGAGGRDASAQGDTPCASKVRPHICGPGGTPVTSPVITSLPADRAGAPSGDLTAAGAAWSRPGPASHNALVAPGNHTYPSHGPGPDRRPAPEEVGVETLMPAVLA